MRSTTHDWPTMAIHAASLAGGGEIRSFAMSVFPANATPRRASSAMGRWTAGRGNGLGEWARGWRKRDAGLWMRRWRTSGHARRQVALAALARSTAGRFCIRWNSEGQAILEWQMM